MPRPHFSDTWQLVINTGTTIVTFIMVFLIQSTQNRDAKAVHLKLDERFFKSPSQGGNRKALFDTAGRPRVSDFTNKEGKNETTTTTTEK